MIQTPVRRVSAAFVCIWLAVGLTRILCAQTAPQDIHRRSKPADSIELAAITERGRAIAAYDAAAWHATDAVQALHPAKDAVAMYLGRQTNGGWIVAFGRLNEAKDTFLLAYEVDPSGDALHPRVVVNTPALEDRGEWLNEARAYDNARAALGQPTRPYNGTVLIGPDSSWYVYFYPAQTTADVFPTGADIRFRVSHDGLSIQEIHRMHQDILEWKMPAPGGKMDMTFRTAFLDDAPEDTDVADNLMIGGVAGFVVAKTFTYHIDADGTAKYLMTTKDFMKTMKK